MSVALDEMVNRSNGVEEEHGEYIFRRQGKPRPRSDVRCRHNPATLSWYAGKAVDNDIQTVQSRLYHSFA